jgi:hypothetical protein
VLASTDIEGKKKFFLPGQTKSCKFQCRRTSTIYTGITTFLETFSQPFLEVRQTQSHFHFPVLYQKHQHLSLLSVFSPVIPNIINKISFCFKQLRPISLVTVQSARPIVARVTNVC